MATLILVNTDYGFARHFSSPSDPAYSIAAGTLALLNEGELGPWAAGRAVTTGQQGCDVQTAGAKQIKALTTGTTGGTTPTFPAVGGTVVDGGVTWKVIAQAPLTEEAPHGTGGWGYLTMSTKSIRIPVTARPQAGNVDGWLVIDDDTDRTRYCLWRAQRHTTGGGVTPGATVFTSTFTDLTGWTDDAVYDGTALASGGDLVLTSAGNAWNSSGVLRRTAAEWNDTGVALATGYKVPDITGNREFVLEKIQETSFPQNAYTVKIKNGQVEIVARKSDTETSLGISNSGPPAGSAVNVRFAITAEGDSRRLRARWWPTDTTEPIGVWHVNALDTTPITSVGTLRVQGAANATDAAVEYRIGQIDLYESITEVEPTVTGWTCAWGAEFPYDEDGRSPSPDYNSPRVWPQRIRGRGTGSGLAFGLGALTFDDFARFDAGLPLNHALISATDLCAGPANDASAFRFPAVTTDGSKLTNPRIQEGTRLQLDPAIDVDAISGITPLEKWIAHGLQTYGTYINDVAGSRLTLAVEIARTDEQRAYYDGLGIGGAYNALPHIPLGSMRALAAQP